MKTTPRADAKVTAGPVRNPDAPTTPVEPTPENDELVEDELLIEDVSIDGMCGVY